LCDPVDFIICTKVEFDRNLTLKTACLLITVHFDQTFNRHCKKNGANLKNIQQLSHTCSVQLTASQKIRLFGYRFKKKYGRRLRSPER